MKEILDSGFINDVKELSNFQLIGILIEKVRYNPKLKIEIKEEVSRRKLSNSEIDLLSKKYQSFNVIEKGEIKLAESAIGVLTITMLIAIFIIPPIVTISAGVIIGISILGVKVKFKKGEIMGERIWEKFTISTAISFCILIVILMLQNIN